MNNVRSLFCVYLLLFLLPISGAAQKRAKADDLLRYFPQLPYLEIGHYYTMRNLPDSEGLRLFNHYHKLEQDLYRTKPPAGSIPKEFSENIVSSMSARIEKREEERMVTTLPETPEERRLFHEHLRKKYRGYSSYYPTKNPALERKQEVRVEIINYEQISIGYYEDSSILFRQALGKGEITAWKDKIEGHTVYAVNNPGLDDDPGGPFLLPVNSKVALFAGRFDHLKKMVLAGNGTIPQLLDDPLFVDLPKLIPQEDFDWTATFHFGGSYERLLGLQEKRASEEDLKYARDILSANPYTFRVTELNDVIIHKTIIVCTNQAFAKKELQQIRESKKIPLDPRNHELYLQYKQYERERTKYELVDNWVIETFVQDETFLKTRQAFYEAMVRARKSQ